MGDGLDFLEEMAARPRKTARERCIDRLAYELTEPQVVPGVDWPERHVVGPDERTPVPFHIGQDWAWDSVLRTTVMSAGTQGGKTGFGPFWLNREIATQGPGDYIAATATHDLFKLKMLPALRTVFERILGIGRYWAADRILEIRDPESGLFLARKSSDLMWARIILRSAHAEGGLEAGTAKAAWLDESDQPKFQIGAYRAIRRRLAIHQGRMLATTTLYPFGWTKSEFIDKANSGGKKTIETFEHGAEAELTINEAVGICLAQYDSIINPSYPLEEYLEAKDTMPPDEFEMFYRGRAATLRYLVYDSFNLSEHTCPRFPIDPTWKRYIGVDFGDVHCAAMFYAEEPGTGQLYCYREYLAGNKTIANHTADILTGEPGKPKLCVGGSWSEKQWRLEFSTAGLPMKKPAVKELGIGINRVYGCHARDQIIYFDDLVGIIDEKQRYRKKRDREGNVTDEIQDKRSFHRLDGERYIVATKFHDTGAWTRTYSE